ncbi:MULTISPECIES: hypothetical protein [Bacillus]|uniref:hypothetical protein n=1 Tax=Bacillus TaxID=1386 RepID=UPI00032E3DFD|nr:hypothetical protein ICS_03433 [Bacillus cereus BAG2O-3]EOQ12520.1 hypothetical protein KQ3_01461 [Bacillus cereus B5-2]PEW50176.1 hypothetical protein CN431_06680 [Bacillus cereus]PFW85538.1 hypothetical protein COL27_06900 [Bacillus sp. AFS075960]RFB47665.1 hypothetical protein DZB83_10515 [Bacillus sp. dmp10]HDR8172360.1 hypothetical protein [Bacillus thuringiensis]
MYAEIFKEVVSITHHDYSGCIDKKGWDDPTTGLSIIDKGEGMSGIGIQPHIHIPWTPRHIQEDVDLNLALQLLQKEEW